MKPITLVYEPRIEIIAEMRLNNNGLLKMADWVKSHRPNCTPEGGYTGILDLLPHDGWESGDRPPTDDRPLTDNEMLVEFAGRKCYDSFAGKAGKKSNREYIANTQQGEIPHRSITYHAKMSFFIAGVSRRVSHELIRNYVGADRDEEGAPSQESTRYTEHYGWYVVPPRVVDDAREVETFTTTMQQGYNDYLAAVGRQTMAFAEKYGRRPQGMDRKRIYETASFYLHHSVETSFIWTTNPAALEKLFNERCDAAADAEFQRFAIKWRTLCLTRWPNLFPRLNAKLGLCDLREQGG
jgi:thymidylate synthase (FAD)